MPVKQRAILDILDEHQRLCAFDLLTFLLQAGYTFSPSVLYQTLFEMESTQVLYAENAIVNGRSRKYYKITPPKGLPEKPKTSFNLTLNTAQ